MNRSNLLGGAAKTPTGIEGFDEITGGGLPHRKTTLIVGGPGCGKTVFGLQSLANGALRWDEPGIFVSFEEDAQQVVLNAETFGWDLSAVDQGKLFFLDARVSADTLASGGFDLAGLLATLQAKARQMGARRIVFDAVDVLLTLLDDPVAERRELYRLYEWLGQSGLTGILTAKATEAQGLQVKYYDFVQFMVDCVVMLQQRVDERVLHRELRVVKYRGSSFAENEFPFTIGPRGLEVAGIGTTESEFQVFTERISTGVERLDTMLNGGYIRGTSVLISGNPGTAKSTLGGAFAQAACSRQERTLYISFDETAGELIRNLTSVGIHLGPHVESGQLRIHAVRMETRSAEEHLLGLNSLIREHQPQALVIDPISALIKAGGTATALGVAQRVLRSAKARGMTVVCLSLLDGAAGEYEATPLQISTLADTWIHLSYLSHGGERNRALTVVKSRGTSHSNQVRELVLSDQGVTLADVYAAGGEVLMGTARWEREMAQKAERERLRMEAERRRRELELAEAEITARIGILERELQTRRSELGSVVSEQELVERQAEQARRELLHLRRADEPNSGSTSAGQSLEG